MKHWVLPLLLSAAAHLGLVFLMPKPGPLPQPRPMILEARLVLLAPASAGQPEMGKKQETPAKTPEKAARKPLSEETRRTGTKPSETEKAAPPSRSLPAPRPESMGSPAPETLKERSGETAPERESVSGLPREAKEADILSRVKPLYPLASRRKGESGTVVVGVLLDGQGRVMETRVQSSSGYSALDRSALSAVGKWVFRPGTPSSLLVPIVFRLE